MAAVDAHSAVMFWQELHSGKRGAGVSWLQPKIIMKTNVGSYDCAVRFVAGCVLLILANHSLGWWGLIGIVPILSAIFRFCFIYSLFHLDTTACDQHDAP